MKKQQGFSLIELAIVLVIAGLLLAGVLRGQEWIANAKVKSLAADFRNVPSYLYGYQDRFRVLPGDDAAVASHLAGATKATSDGQSQNGLIQGAWNSTTTTDESYLLWQHLRLAGLVSGSTTTGGAQYLQRNSEGGQIGVTSVASLTGVKAGELNGAHAMCSDGIMGRYATQLDLMLDDGVGNTGAMRILSTTASNSTGENTVDTSTGYMVCMSF